MAFTEIDEKLLVRAYQAGDERAFDTIVRTQYNALYAHALRRLSDHDSAEDAVQDTLLRAYRALPNLDGDLALRAWLHRILTNVCHDEGNRRRRQQGLVEKVGALPEELADDPVDEAVLHDTVRIMSEALKDLPESYREALVLRYVDGLSFRDVAEATGTTEENARARVHRGRLALHRILSRVAIVLAFLIPGLRRTQAATTSSGADHAVSTGMSEHAVSVTTQLTSHALSAAPTLSRLAEIGSAFPGGKSALAAAAVTAVAAVSVPVAVHTVSDVNRSARPPAAVASPAPRSAAQPGGRADDLLTSSAAAPLESTTTTVAHSLAYPFGQGTLVPDATTSTTSTSSVPPSTTTTTTRSGPPSPASDARLLGSDVTIGGDAPQYSIAAAVQLNGSSGSREGELIGRLFLFEDGTASSDDLVFTFDEVSTTLRFRGDVDQTVDEDGTTTYIVGGNYLWKGASAFGVAEHSTLQLVLRRTASGSASLEFLLAGGR